MRNFMYPHTAMNLRVRKSNCLKDFISVAGVFGVTHMIVFTGTETSNYMKIMKNP